VRGTVDDLDLIDLEVIDPAEANRGRSDAITDFRSFEDRYATLAFGLGVVPRREHPVDAIWQRPAGLLIAVSVVLTFLTLVSTVH
jgi:hypothetical protein